MQRLLPILLGVTVVIAAVGGLTYLWLREKGPNITRANFNRIQVGMTKADVKKMLGPPTSSGVSRDSFWYEWQGKDCQITVMFSVDGPNNSELVDDCIFVEYSVFERMLRSVGL